MSTQQPKPSQNRFCSRPLILAALMTGGILQPYLPAFAAGTTPQTISNTATAEYKNDNNEAFTATSNTVEVTVAEVAGLSVTPAGVKDSDGGAVQAGDTLSFDFKVTNIGNAPTDIVVPALANISTENLIPSAGGLEYAIVAADGTVGTFTPLPDTGGVISNLPADASVIIRVTGTVPTSGLSAGADIRVTLGDTLPNDNSPATQNQPDVGPAGDDQAKDIRTQNIGEKTPINGEREASATQFVDFATEIKPLALATLRKNAATVTANTAVSTDDQITYALSLTVENTSPNAAFSPEQLAPTDITLENIPAKRILISDVIPDGTVFDPTIAPTAPAGWSVVYSTDSPTSSTIPIVATGGIAVNWTASQPQAALVKRIGFIHNGPLPANGAAITDFKFTVVTSGLPTTGGPVYNIAQVFGQTYDSDNPVNPTNEVVYDESGDSNPNNFNDNQTPPDNTGSNFNPATDTGVANPATQGIDPPNTPDNDGVGPGGEDTKVNIGTTPTTNEDIFNGPSGKPGATGPTDFNDDFTNVSAKVPAGTQEAFNPEPVTINNTVQNPSTNSVALSNVTIEPISPKQAEGADPSSTPGKFGSNAEIPNGTIVTIRYDGNNDGDYLDPQDQVATYTYNSTKGIFEIAPGTKPVNVGELAPGQTVNYQVVVDLPKDDNLTKPLADIPIPILAFSDDDPVKSPGYNDTLNIQAGGLTPDSPGYKAPELNNNVTNDNIYLGYMELIKEARILDAAGSVKEDWKSVLTQNALPGDVIEYRIRYKNISNPMQGSGNVILNAQDFKILEDGGAAAVGDATANNWATLTNHQPTTKFDKGTVEYFQGTGSTTSLGGTDPAANSQVGTYRNDVGSVVPNESGEFIFRRQVNN